MASMWRKAMLYLGLGPDDEYEDYDERAAAPEPEQPAASRTAGATRARPAPSRPAAPPTRSGPSPARAPRPTPPPPDAEPSSVRTIAPPSGPPSTPPAEPPTTKPRTVVRPVPAAARPHLVAPTSFNEAQDVADRFKANQPVILNLQGVDRELARRLIDFSSGLCYGLVGHMEKIAHQVYLLTPNDVEVSAEERRRWAERGLPDA